MVPDQSFEPLVRDIDELASLTRWVLSLPQGGSAPPKKLDAANRDKEQDGSEQTESVAERSRIINSMQIPPLDDQNLLWS